MMSLNCVDLIASCLQVVIIYWEEEFGWSVSSLSALMALVHICNGITTPLSGYLIDKHPSHLCIAGGLGFLAVSLALTALVTTAWQIWVVYGVMCGSAFGLLNLNVFSVAVMQQLPPEQHGLAVGCATSGSTFGQFALVPAFTLVTRSYGWRAGYLALAVSAVLLIPPTLLLLRGVKPAPSSSSPADVLPNLSTPLSATSSVNSENDQNNGNDDSLITEESECLGHGGGVPPTSQQPKQSLGNTEIRIEMTPGKSSTACGDHDCVSLEEPRKLSVIITDKAERPSFREKVGDMWSCPQFHALTVAFFFCGFTTTGFIETHLVRVAVDNDFSVLTGSLAFSVLAACNGLSMVAVGRLADVLNRHLILSTIFLVRGLSFFLLLSFFLQAGEHVSLFVFAVLFGVANYSVVPPVVSLVKTHLPSSVGLSVGVLLMFHSAGAAAGSSVGGLFYQIFGQYDEVIVLCAALCLSAAAVCVTMQMCGRGREEKLFRAAPSSQRVENEE